MIPFINVIFTSGKFIFITMDLLIFLVIKEKPVITFLEIYVNT